MPTDNDTDLGQLYLLTEDGHKESMAATALCIPDLVNAEMDEDVEPYEIAFSLRDSYSASFTLELTDESVRKIGRLFRATRRWSRKKEQQRKRKIAKEKNHGLLHKET